MLSDIENLDIMLGERHSVREESVHSKQLGGQKVPIAMCLKTMKKTST